MRRLFLAIAVVVILGVGVWAVPTTAPPPPTPVAETEEPKPETLSALLDHVEGDVRVRRADGSSENAVLGGELLSDQQVTTGKDGRARIAFGQGSSVDVKSQSSLQVVSVSPDGVELELEGGAVRAVVRPGSAPLRVRNQDRVAIARDATFEASASDDGTLALQTFKGRVQVEGIDGVTSLASGKRVIDSKGRPPLLTDIPADVLLNVAWPGTKVRDSQVKVRGRTTPGARVAIISRRRRLDVVADAKGRFAANVRVSEGNNQLRVEARDVFGKVVSATHQITRDTKPPAVKKFEVRSRTRRGG